MTKLPKKPSALLMLALTDLEQVEKDPRYEVDMARWHRPNGRCAVCFAGSVMARTLETPPDKLAYPSDFSQATSDALDALNASRAGGLGDAFYSLGISLPESSALMDGDVDRPEVLDIDMPEYGRSGKLHDLWWQTMQSLIGILQAEKL